MDFCLAQAGITLAEVDHVAYSYDPARFIRDRHIGELITLPLSPSAHPPGGWDNVWDPLFASYIVNAPRQLASAAPHHLKARFRSVRHDGPYRFHFVSHHLSHQASAFLAAPFDRCAVMTLDGRGEDATTTYGVYREGGYTPLGEVCMPHSLGLLYERITTHLGFLHSSDEYKVMALAALGQPRFADVLQAHVQRGDDGQYTIEPLDLVTHFGPPRERGAALESPASGPGRIAAAGAGGNGPAAGRMLQRKSGESNLAMAGGVALNCVMNAPTAGQRPVRRRLGAAGRGGCRHGTGRRRRRDPGAERNMGLPVITDCP